VVVVVEGKGGGLVVAAAREEGRGGIAIYLIDGDGRH